MERQQRNPDTNQYMEHIGEKLEQTVKEQREPELLAVVKACGGIAVLCGLN